MDLAIALRAFIRTLERGSLTAAAQDLGVSQPAVTKHLRNLERHVGARLLERSNRMVRPTAPGLSLYEASRSALATIDSALEGVRRDMGEIEGTLRLHAPTCLGIKHFHGIVAAFQARYPTVSVDLLLENRNIDPVYDNVDLALIYGRPEGQDLIVRRLGLIRRILVASPRLLAAFGPIRGIEDLSRVPMITTVGATTGRDTLALQHGAEAVNAAVRPLMRTNSAEVLVSTLLDGRAAGAVQHLLIAEELASGTLVRVLPDYEVKPNEAFLAYPSTRFMRPAVRAFTDFAVPALRAIEGIDVVDPVEESAPRKRASSGGHRKVPRKVARPRTRPRDPSEKGRARRNAQST